MERDALSAEVAADSTQRMLTDIERVESQSCSGKTRMNIDFSDGEKSGQDSVHKALLLSDTDRQVGREAELIAANRTKEGLIHLEEARGKLQHRSR